MNQEYNKPYLYLDDIRSPGDSAQYMIGLEKLYHDSSKWAVVRNCDDFCDYVRGYVIKNGALPFLISFDHDLADEQYYIAPITQVEYNKKYKSFKYETGLHCAYFLINICKEFDLKLPDYECHSMNPIGKKNIIDLLSDYEKGKEIEQLDKRYG